MKCYGYVHQNGRKWTVPYNNVWAVATFFLTLNVRGLIGKKHLIAIPYVCIYSNHTQLVNKHQSYSFTSVW